VLRGRELWERFTPEANREARRLYEKAIELDPDYARAYASLAWTYLVEDSERWASPEDQPLERALELARQGVMVNPASHSNYLALGQVCLSKGLHDEALEALETAITLNPNDADGYVFLAQALNRAGRPDEAISLVESPAPQSRCPALVHVEPRDGVLSRPPVRRRGHRPAERQAAPRNRLPMAGGCLRPAGT
jgi:Tetratricopeptide repeat